MSSHDAYAAAGVDIGASDEGVGALVGVLKTIELGRPSTSVLASGHYAAVLRVTDDLGIALSTDGVGSKLVVAERTGRLDTVGIDCVAMNVNDIVCVGAEPMALLDYLAVEQPDPDALAAIARGLKVGAEAAGVEIPGGELAVIPELIRGHGRAGSHSGFDLCASCFGTVALDAIVTGERIAPGDVLVGIPSSGLHSNGYTLARHVLEPLGDDATPPELGGATVADVLLEPTVIYVRAVLDLLRSDIAVHGLAHITGGGLTNLQRLNDGVGFAVDAPLPVLPVFSLIQRLGDVAEEEMYEVFNMGCGFVAVVPSEQAQDAASLLASHHPGAAIIGSVTADAGHISREMRGAGGPSAHEHAGGRRMPPTARG
jgi:phosphoribosylformylglycinamidine cyclo-ligase